MHDPPRPSRPRLTIITPVYNEAGNLGQFAEVVSRTIFAREDFDARLLFVDDGSADQSWAMIHELVGKSTRFEAIRLSRNFGAHTALAAGFDHVHSSTDIVATLACDLQDPPETILGFVDEWRKGADIVWGARRQRGDQGWRQAASQFLDIVIRRYAMPRNSRFQTGSFFLIDRVVLESLLKLREHGRVTFALVAWTGFQQAVVQYDRQARLSGRSGWTLGNMINTAYDVFIGFSPIPAKVLTILGFSVFGLSAVALVYLIVTWLVQDVQPGWTGLMAAMTLCFGMLFVMLGIMSEYLHRIFIEAKDRPLYFVARRIGSVADREGASE